MQPAEFVVRQEIREKLACDDGDGELCRAPLPERVVAKGRFGVKLVACIVVDKYRDGLALHRQLPRFRRLGASLPLSTLVDQVAHVAAAAKILQPAAIGPRIRRQRPRQQGGACTAPRCSAHGRPYSIVVTAPSLGAVFFKAP